MKARVFTETWLKSLVNKTPPKQRDDTREIGRKGFYLRWWPGGTLTFVLRYGPAGKSILPLGNYPATSLEQAHKAHAAARELLSKGFDPIEERERDAKARQIREQKEKADNAITARSVIAEWGWHYARRERKHPREAIRLLKVYIAEPWKGRAVRDLTKRDAVLLLDRIVARGSEVMANRIYNLGLQCFTFDVKRDLITNNPFLGIGRPGGDESPRERMLDQAEVHTFWTALDREHIEISRPVRLALRLILVTAQRPGEVAGAAWSEIDTDRGVWTIPPQRSKNGKEHEVPLSDLALEVLGELRELAKGRPHVLPSVHSNLKHDEPLSVRALSRALKNNHDKHGKLFGLEPFTPHDLRRTAASMMTSLGVPRLHVSKVLNHTDQDITGKTYDKHEYFPEKQAALYRWADHLRDLLAGKNARVVPIARELRV